MIIEKDDEKSSGIAMPEKSYAGYFNGANIQTLIFGESVYEKVDKKHDVERFFRGKQHSPSSAATQGAADTTTVTITRDILGRGIKAVQDMFWGQSSHTVIYCTLRDIFRYDPGITVLEALIQDLHVEYKFDYLCPDNTISSTLYNNRYMRLHIDKWEAHNAKDRIMKLVQAFIAAIRDLIIGD